MRSEKRFRIWVYLLAGIIALCGVAAMYSYWSASIPVYEAVGAPADFKHFSSQFSSNESVPQWDFVEGQELLAIELRPGPLALKFDSFTGGRALGVHDVNMNVVPVEIREMIRQKARNLDAEITIDSPEWIRIELSESDSINETLEALSRAVDQYADSDEWVYRWYDQQYELPDSMKVEQNRFFLPLDWWIQRVLN